MARYAEPKPPEKVNACIAGKATATRLQGPFRREGSSHSYVVPIAGIEDGDSMTAPRQSTIVLCEDDVPLGPAHAIHDDIRSRDEGRYSHWIDHLYFSASDNSDPNTNKRSYTVVDTP